MSKLYEKTDELYQCKETGLGELELNSAQELILFSKDEVKMSQKRIDRNLSELTDYGKTIDEIRTYVETHLGKCSSCRQEYQKNEFITKILLDYVWNTNKSAKEIDHESLLEKIMAKINKNNSQQK